MAVQGMASVPAVRNVGRQRDTLVDMAYKELLEAILYRRLQPGEPLGLDRMAAQLGMSRTPVNLALSRLHGDGLVSYLEHVGFVVRVLTEKELYDIFDLRLLYEQHAVESGLASAPAACIEKVAALHEEIKLSTDWVDPEAYRRFWELDGQFHRAIVRLSPNELLQEWFGRLHYHMLGVRLGLLAREALPFELMFREHDAIVGALRAADVAAAREALRRHITRSCEVSIARLAKANAAASGT